VRDTYGVEMAAETERVDPLSQVAAAAGIQNVAC